MKAPLAIATCADYPALHPDDQPLIELLQSHGVGAEPAVWTDPGADWSRYRAVVVRSTWDYATRRDEFLEWMNALGASVHNPAHVIRWNTDKRYLRELGKMGLPIVPTVWVDCGGTPHGLPSSPECVVKPVVSAGSRDTLRLRTRDEHAIRSHVAAIHETKRAVMIQPYVDAIDDAGETAMIYIGGSFSHAVRKGPLLPVLGQLPTDGLYAEEAIEARTPHPKERAVADAVLGALPFGPLVYARIDLVPGPTGPQVLEVELTEPSLFFEVASGSRNRFVEALLGALEADAATRG